MVDFEVSVDYQNNAALVGAQIEAALKQGILKAAEHLLAETIPKVPLDQGTLRNSGGVSQTVENQGLTAIVSFDTPYAARLHEHPEYNFQEPGTGGKFLENTANEEKSTMGAIIAAEVRRASNGR